MVFTLVSVPTPAITTLAIPAAPLVAVTVTPVELLKSMVATLPAVPTTAPVSDLIVRPPMAPTPPAVIPVRFDPSPYKTSP